MKVSSTVAITLVHILKGTALTEAIKDENKKADGTEDSARKHTSISLTKEK